MAKVIKFDLSGADEETWEQGDGRISEPPKPGIYKMLVREINPGYSKDDSGKEDKGRPRLEVILETVADAKGSKEALATMGHDGGDCAGAWCWDYVSFSKASEWKQAQFFKAIGEGSPKKAKGKFNAEKHEGKTFVKVRVKAGSNQDGDYQPKVAAMWPWEGDNADVDEDIDAELDGDAGEEAEEHTEEELRAMDRDDLLAAAKAAGVEVVKGKKKNTYVQEILAAQEAAEEDEDEEDDDDDWDDEDEDESSDGPTAEEIREMSPADLKALAKEHGVSLKGMKKSAAIEALIEAVVGDEDEDDDDDVPF